MKYRVKYNNSPVYDIKERVLQCIKAPCPNGGYDLLHQIGVRNAGDIIEGTEIDVIGYQLGSSPTFVSWVSWVDGGDISSIRFGIPIRNLQSVDENGNPITSGLNIDLKTGLMLAGIALLAYYLLKPKHK